MDGSSKGRGAARGIAMLVVGFLAAGAFVVGPASAGKFLTKKAGDRRYYNVGETVANATNATNATTAQNANQLQGSSLNAVLSAARPVAMANIGSNGAVVSGTSNVSSTWNAGSGWYEITIAGVSYHYNTSGHVTNATLSTCATCHVREDSSGGKLLIRISDASGNPVQQEFQFVTHAIPA